MVKKYSKYHVDLSDKGKEKRTYEGIVFDSETELKFLKEWIEPKIKTGEILRYERQIPYVLQDGFVNFEKKKILPIKYVADYVVYFPNGSYAVIDVKGEPDSAAKIKKKMFEYRYRDINYYWYCRNIKYGDDTHWLQYKELEVKRKADKKSKKI